MTRYRHSQLNQQDLMIFRKRNSMAHVGILFFVTLVAYSLCTADTRQGTVLRIELKETQTFKNERSPDNPLNQVKAFLELEPIQPDVARGIMFMVDIVNAGSGSVVLADPTERVNVGLVNHEGWPCSRGPVPTISKIKTGDPKATRARLDARRAFVMERNGVDPRLFKTVHDIKGGKIRLEPGDQLRLVLRIEKIVANAREYNLKRRQYTREHNPHSPDFKEPHLLIPLPQPTIAPIPPGSYKLGVGVLLSRRDGPGGKSLVSDKVTVRLAPQSTESK